MFGFADMKGITMKPALLVIDMQRYYLEVGSAEKLRGVSELIAKTNELIDLFYNASLPVVKVRVIHKKDGSTWNQKMKPHWTGEVLPGTLTEGTTEAEFCPELHSSSNDIILTKTRSSSFVRTALEEKLQSLGVDTVIITGYSIERCVGLTAIDAWERDYRVVLAGDAILGANKKTGDHMLAYLAQSFGLVPISNAEIHDRYIQENTFD